MEWIKTDDGQMINPMHISCIFIRRGNLSHLCFQMMDGTTIDHIESAEWVYLEDNLMEMVKELKN